MSQEAYRASHNSVMESLRTKLDMMLFQVSEDPLTVEYRQLAGAYGEVTHLTRTTDCVNQADIKQKVSFTIIIKLQCSELHFVCVKITFGWRY